MLSEAEIYRHLERYRFQNTLEAPFGEIAISMEPQDLHTRTSPDLLLTVTIRFKLAGQPIALKLPIPIEAEKAGWKAAMEDLDKLAQRRQYPIELPFLVIGNGGYDMHRVQRDLPVNINVLQIPDRDVTP